MERLIVAVTLPAAPAGEHIAPGVKRFGTPPLHPKYF
jgi:hypothetical protein